jgi:hypothetical protein
MAEQQSSTADWSAFPLTIEETMDETTEDSIPPAIAEPEMPEIAPLALYSSPEYGM